MAQQISGIYIILNTKNGKVYVGQSQDIDTRFSNHKTALKGGYHPNVHLQHAWNKYGKNAFEFQVLEQCPVEKLDECEQHYLDHYIPTGMCYNIAICAESPGRGLNVNTYHSTTHVKVHEHRGRGRKVRSSVNKIIRAYDDEIIAGIGRDEPFMFHGILLKNHEHASHKLHIDSDFAALLSVRVRTGDLEGAEAIYEIAAKKRANKNKARKARHQRKHAREMSNPEPPAQGGF